MDSSKGRIMLVDDSDNLRSVIKEWLIKEGYEVIDFSDEVTANRAFNRKMFDICIIDISTPGKDGFSLLQNIRRFDRDIPVIILSARSDRDERIKGFRLGCDDYIIKPFSIEELVLRIQAILRRCSGSGNPDYGKLYDEKIYKLGDFTFNYSAMQLIHPTITRMLTRKEAELLKLLCDHPGKLIPREIIMKEVWGEEDHAISRSMDVFLTKIRSYLRVGTDAPLTPKAGRGRHKASTYPHEQKVEICNVHGTGFILKINQ